MKNFVSVRTLMYGTALAAGMLGLFTGVSMLQKAIAQVAMVEAPMFEVDPLWPKPLPNEGLLGMTIGVSIDAQDNVWIVHRGAATLNNNEKGAELNPPVAICCRSAPPVIAFNQDGDVIHAWGGKGEGYEWPESMHGITVDNKGNVWLGGNGAKDSQILKFTQDGKFIMQSGHQGKNAGSNDPENFGRVAADLCRSEEQRGLRRRRLSQPPRRRDRSRYRQDQALVGRLWQQAGRQPEGPYNPQAAALQQFRSPVHCVALANDGLLYVCDRQHDRVQMFHTDGKFVNEHFFAKDTLASGSTWEIAFSKDPRAALHLPDRRPERARAHRRARQHEGTHLVRSRRPPTRASSSVCTASPPTRRATSIRPRPMRVNACRNSTTRASAW